MHAPLRLSRQVAVLKAKQGGTRSHAQVALAGAGFEWAAGAGAQAALPAASGPPVQACANRTHHAYLLRALHHLRGHCKGVSFRILYYMLQASCPLQLQMRLQLKLRTHVTAGQMAALGSTTAQEPHVVLE